MQRLTMYWQRIAKIFLIFLGIHFTWLYLHMELFLHSCIAWTPQNHRFHDIIQLSETMFHSGCHFTFCHKFDSGGISLIFITHANTTNYWYSLGLIINSASQCHLWTFLIRRLDGLRHATVDFVKNRVTSGGIIKSVYFSPFVNILTYFWELIPHYHSQHWFISILLRKSAGTRTPSCDISKRVDVHGGTQHTHFFSNLSIVYQYFRDLILNSKFQHYWLALTLRKLSGYQRLPCFISKCKVLQLMAEDFVIFKYDG